MNKNELNLKKWYENVAKRYDCWGEKVGECDFGNKKLEILNFDKLLNEISSPRKVLDVGTGTGVYLLWVIEKFKIPGWGVDISREMLNQLKIKIEKNRVSNINLKKCSAFNICISEKEFDLIICMGLFDYYSFDEISKFLIEFKRLSSEKAKFIFDFPNVLNEEIFAFKKIEESVGNKVHLHTFKEIIKFLKNEGFNILKFNYVGLEIQFLVENEI